VSERPLLTANDLEIYVRKERIKELEQENAKLKDQLTTAINENGKLRETITKLKENDAFQERLKKALEVGDKEK